jgi:hypothetical protein
VVLPRRGRVARPRRGRVARPWNRRTRAQRLGIVLLVLVSQVVVWVFTASWPIRIVAALAAVLVTPALVTLSLDRSSR